MNAQELINETQTGEVWNKEKLFNFFYPNEVKKKQAELNLSLVVGK